MHVAQVGTTIDSKQVQDQELVAIAARRQNGLNAEEAAQRDFAALDATVTERITQRRIAPAFQDLMRKLNDPAQTELWTAHASKRGQPTAANLTGLALSGGGIRSATFNLGVLQVLQWTGVLKFVDYLSTVSGGGYLGAALSSWFGSTNKDRPHSFPLVHESGTSEPPLFRHFRNNAEYLAPSGLVDYLRIPMTVVRGMVVNLLVILPYLLLAALLTKLVHPTAESLQHDWVRENMNWVPQWLGNHFIFTKLLMLTVVASFVIYPLFCVIAQVTGLMAAATWTVRSRAGRIYAGLLVVIAIVAVIEAQPIVLQWLLQEARVDIGRWAAGMTALQSLLPVMLSAWLMKNASKLLGRYVLALVGLSAVLAFWVIELALAAYLISEPQYTLDMAGLWLPITVMCVLFLYGFLFVDVNATSVHAFYRDRLSRAYLVKPERKPGSEEYVVAHNDKQLLSQLNTRCCPYHLINAAINLHHADEAYRKGRYADSFIFSPLFVGSESTGYCPTYNLERQTSQLDLGTAMAISGAAAAPNMGKQTNRLLAFFLAMLNVRLNYWLPNPRYTVNHERRRRTRPPQRVGPLYLLRELFGRLSNRSINVNLSDGGHFDNMGLYELLRRQCRFIICCDGEADPRLQFNGLTEALRMAQVDFGTLINVQGLDAIRAGKQHYAIGRIRYAGNREGWLLYLKQSLSGDDSLLAALGAERFAASAARADCGRYDEGAFIAEYKSRFPDFPHQSTSDQFFDEAQFECTRAQGYNVAYRTMTIT